MIRIIALQLLLLAILTTACDGGSGPSASPTPTSTRAPATPSPSPTTTSSPTPTPTPGEDTDPPDRDLIDLARRFRGLPTDTPRIARETPRDYSPGDREEFVIVDLEAPATYRISAAVALVTDHADFFVEDGVSYSQSALKRIGSDFESIVYPGVTEAFGHEWTPGVDSDPRITILHTYLSGAGGYFSSSDEYPKAVVPYSNEREMIYVDASVLGSPGPAYNALLAHELQHMVHWNTDESEEAWVNEGMSQVAARLVGGGSDWFDSFLLKPDTQLNHWPPLDDTAIHYAASELFFSYVVDRFGGAAALAAEPGDGIAGVDAYLAASGTTFRDVFTDWVVANYLDEDEGPYSHPNSDARVRGVTTIRRAGDGGGAVHQFAADYLEVEPPDGRGVFVFDGAEEVTVGIPALDGPFWWSGRGDLIDSRLTRELDLADLQSATLRFSAWFDTERGWDYSYVAVSTDEGDTWRTLPAESTTTYDPVGNAYGPGYTGDSGGWISESVDLTELAGSKVLIRFETVNDDAANLAGFAVDNIEVPEFGFHDTADSSDGWTAEGYRRIDRPLRQEFVLQVVTQDGGTNVSRVDLDAANRAEIPLDGAATVIVSAVTENTAEAAPYTWELRAP